MSVHTERIRWARRRQREGLVVYDVSRGVAGTVSQILDGLRGIPAAAKEAAKALKKFERHLAPGRAKYRARMLRRAHHPRHVRRARR